MTKDILFSGVASVPADYAATDGSLALTHNAIPHADGLHPIPSPQYMCAIPEHCTVRYIHAASGFTHYILVADSNHASPGVYWFNTPTVAIDSDHLIAANLSPSDITAVGNMLILSFGHSAPIQYYIWRTSSYISLGSSLPNPRISFTLVLSGHTDELCTQYSADMVFNSGGYPVKYSNSPAAPGITSIVPHSADDPLGEQQIECVYHHSSMNTMYSDSSKQEDQKTLRDAVFGAINYKIASDVWGEGRFCHPFLVCYAIKLFDGTYVSQSAPVLMNTRSFCHKFYPLKSGSTDENLYASVMGLIYHYDLKMRREEGISADLWRDIVSSVDIFVSAPFYDYDQTDSATAKFSFGEDEAGSNGAGKLTDHFGACQLSLPPKDLNKQITDCSNFYLIKSIPLSELPSDTLWHDVEIEHGNYLANLTSHKSLPQGFHPRTAVRASGLYSYNSRLHVFAPKLDLFSGFRPEEMLAPYDIAADGSEHLTTGPALVTLESPNYGTAYAFVSGVSTIDGIADQSDSAATSAAVTRPLYFYYPDSSARLLQLDCDTWRYDIPLQPHAFLPGAFAYYPVGSKIAMRSVGLTQEQKQAYASNNVSYPSSIYVSEVSNPLAFSAQASVSVGNAKVMALASAVAPLSEGQFGSFPLYAFTSEGVWALELSATGTYSARQPITRDVLLSTSLIVSLDNSVVFGSARGLLCLTGRQSVSISDDIDGVQFPLSALASSSALQSAFEITPVAPMPARTYMANSRLLYDYRNQHLWMFNPSMSYAYVYSLRTKAWGMAPHFFSLPLNSYPYAYVMTTTGALYDVAGQASASGAVPIMAVTRPFSIDDADTFKTIDALLLRGNYASPSSVSCALYGTRDLVHYFLVGSSVTHALRGIQGSPYKRFVLIARADLAPTDALTGFSVSYRPRLADQLR